MISKELLKLVLTEQRNYFLAKPKGVPREVLQRIRKKRKMPHIHVITGIRRCGKSTLLRQIASEFYKDRDFYYLSFEDERLLNFRETDFSLIYETMLELFGSHKTFLIDEIQQIRNFDSFVRRFFDQGFKFYLTGSNAGLLQEEISTRLTGRHTDTRLHPFSFREFQRASHLSDNPDDVYTSEKRSLLRSAFDEYLTLGGMPEYVLYRDSEIIRRNYEDIIIRDIFFRKKPKDIHHAKELYLYLISEFARRFSYNSLQKAIAGNLSVNTIKSYVGFLAESYLVSIISRFDFSVAKQLVNEKKVYVCDNAFVLHLSTRPGADKGWLLENLVAGMLHRDENELFYYAGKKECDFVIMNQKRVGGAFQVCWEINHLNEKREYAGLSDALDYLGLKEGTIITHDQEEEKWINGRKITIIPAWKWATQRN